MAYYELEPFGSERADQRTASIVQVIANSNRPPGKKPYELSEAQLPTPYKANQDQAGDLLAKVKGIHKLLGGKEP